MKTFEFTPGPWSKDQFGDLRGNNQQLVEIWGLGAGHTSKTVETYANAILMRSAPELYNALHTSNLLMKQLAYQITNSRFFDNNLYGMDEYYESQITKNELLLTATRGSK